MAQSNFSGTSLWLLVLGQPTCLLCWVDIFALCPESSSLKKEETSSALQTGCFVDRVSSSPSDSSEDIIDKCNAWLLFFLSNHSQSLLQFPFNSLPPLLFPLVLLICTIFHLPPLSFVGGKVLRDSIKYPPLCAERVILYVLNFLNFFKKSSGNFLVWWLILPCSTTVLTVPSWSGRNAKDQGAVRFFFFLKNSAASLHHSFQSHGWLVWLLAWISCLP